ncbi:MAG: hypothetical protein P8Y70_04915 [Candidatus Lokiarchaeota archaeon]
MRHNKIIHTKRSKKRFLIRFSSLILITIISLSSLFIIFNFQANSAYYNDNSQTNVKDMNLDGIKNSDASFFYPPFNYTKIWDFFQNNYASDLDYNVKTYYRYGDSSGNIVNDSVYSLDNLLMYNTLLSKELTSQEIFEKYLQLKSSGLWYQGNASNFQFGFIESVANSTGYRYTRRNLIDNLMPIFLLTQQFGSEMTSLNVDGTTPKLQLEEMFNLINSSVFWDKTNQGFRDFNSSTGTKYTESNLYGILANLLISQTTALDSSLRDRALELANETMNSLLNNMWEDGINIGFYYSSNNDWTNQNKYKYLSVNALGLSALLDFWKQNNLTKDSLYLSRARNLYAKMNLELWNPTYNAYENYRDASWSTGDDTINLEGNALMMNALLKFYDLTGNSTYFSKAMTLFNTFENSFYDKAVGAFNNSISTPSVPLDGYKNFYTNLKVCESYLNAIDIYQKSSLTSEFNSSRTIPAYKFNSDSLVLTSRFLFLSEYANSSIDNANITYIVRYPNETIIDMFDYKTDVNGSNTFIYNVTDNLPIGKDYSIIVYARSDYFKMQSLVKYFNVTSGLSLVSGLGNIESLYQGQETNLTLVLNSTRSEDINLSLAIVGKDLVSTPIQVSFEPVNVSTAYINFTVKPDASIGSTDLHLILRNGSIIYLDVIKTIKVMNALQYTDLIYQNEVVGDDVMRVSIQLTNFLPNNTQTINVSFVGDYISTYRKEFTLQPEEITTLEFLINTTIVTYQEEFNVTMEISKGNTTSYSNIFNIQILPPLEIVSSSFPTATPQGAYATFILIVRNNRDKIDGFGFYVNGIRKHVNNDEFLPGENIITYKVQPTINPYDFNTKHYSFILRNSNGDIIQKFYYEINPQLSAFNFFIFYLLPIVIPIAIVVIYKNKDIKNKMLKR